MKTKELLYEWKSFLNETKVVSLAELRRIMSRSQEYTDEDIEYLNSFWNNPSNQFLSKYSQVIKNAIIKKEPIDHILKDVKLHYHKVYQTAPFETKRRIALGDISVEDLRKVLDRSSRFNSREIRQQCSYQNGRPVVGKYQDFDVIYSESDWVVIEPKTIRGSISWAHGKPDGSEERNEKRRVGWCTAVNNQNNMFPNYAGNLHMFYVINSDYDNDMTNNRRLCLSFIVSEGEIKIQNTGGATVNANNTTIPEPILEKIKSEKYYSLILQQLEGRENTSFSEIYKKATLSQILRSIAQMKSQRVEKDLVVKEIENYIYHTDKADVLDYFYENYKEESINTTILYRLTYDYEEKFDNFLNKVLDNNIKEELQYLGRQTRNQKVIDYFLNHPDLIIKSVIVKNMNAPLSLQERLNIVKELFDIGMQSENSIEELSLAITSICTIYRSASELLSGNSQIMFSYNYLKNALLRLFKLKKFNEEVFLSSGMHHPSDTYQFIVMLKNTHRNKFSKDVYLWFCFIRDNFLRVLKNVSSFCKPIIDEESLPQKVVDGFIDYFIESLNNPSYQEQNGLSDLISHIVSYRNISNEQYENLIAAVANRNNVSLGLFGISVNYRMNKRLSLDLFNRADEKTKTRMAVKAKQHLGTTCPKVILDYIKNQPISTTELFSNETINLSFEEFREKAADVDFSDMVSDFSKGVEDVDYEEYEYFFHGFPASRACQENPAEMYNFLKSKGLDLSSESIFENVFYDIMAWGFESFEELVEEYPHFIPLFNQNANQNEALLINYLRLVLS